MSSSKTPVTIEVGGYHGELEVVDGRFRVVDSGFGRLQTELAPGIYKARARAGEVRVEELFVVEPEGGSVEVSLPLPEFASPAPLAGTSTTHEYHMDPLAHISQEPPVDYGLGRGAARQPCG